MPVYKLTEQHGYVALVASSTFVLNMWQSMRISGLSKELRATNPQIPFDHHFTSKCYQRARQNTVEHSSFFLATLFLAGIRFPCFGAIAGAFWVVGKVLFTLGYSNSNPDHRMPAALFSYFLGQVPLVMMSVGTGAGLLGWF